MNQTFEKIENTSLNISAARVVPIDIISIIQEKQRKKEMNNNQIIVNTLPESSKIIESTMHKQDSQLNLLHQKDVYARSSFRSIGSVCRLCELPERKDNPLIRVCRCIRSKKYVHEYCLKKSLLNKYRHNIAQAKCEICQDAYSMEVKIEKLFQPRIAWRQSKDKIPLACLVVFLIVMLVVLIFLCLRLAESSEITDRNYFLNSQSFLIIFIIFAFIIILILLWFIIMIIKGLLFVEKIVLWKLMEYKPIKKSILNKNILLSEIQQSFRKSKLVIDKSKAEVRNREKAISIIEGFNRNDEQLKTLDALQQTTQRQLGVGITSHNMTNCLTDPRSSSRVRFSII